MHRTVRKIISVALLATVVLVALLFARSDISIDSVREWISTFGLAAPAVFIGVYALATIALIPGTILTLTAGALFGAVAGTVYTVVGASLGATGAFLLARGAGQDYVRSKVIARFPKLASLNESLGREGLPAVLLLRLVPLFPFIALNYGLGLTAIKTRDYVVGTVVGIVPGSFAYATAGSAAAALDVQQLVIASSVLVALSVAGWLHKRRQKNTPACDPADVQQSSE